MNYQFKPFALSRLTNAAHIAFMGNVKSIIDNHDVEVLDIDEKSWTNFTRALEKEVDVCNRARRSVYTGLMKEADDRRNNFFRRIHYRLLLAQTDIDNPAMTAAIRNSLETDFLQQYPLAICNSKAQDKTAKIRGFLHDLDSLFSAMIEKLDLKADMDALAKENDDFEAHYISRLNERIATVDSATFRAATEKAYQQVCYRISFLANFDAASTEEKIKTNNCQRTLLEINQLIKEFKQKLSNSTGTNGDADDIYPDDDLELENPSQEQAPSQNQTPPVSGGNNSDPIFD